MILLDRLLRPALGSFILLPAEICEGDGLRGPGSSSGAKASGLGTKSEDSLAVLEGIAGKFLNRRDRIWCDGDSF